MSAVTPVVFTVAELAAYLHVHRSTIYRQVSEGIIPAFKVGSDWRFNKESIDRWRMEREGCVPQTAR